MKKIKKLKNSFLSRNIGLTKLALKAGSGLLFSRDELKDRLQKTLTNHAQSMANELNMMKGSVMKAGQMLSLFAGDFLPKEFNQFLKQLESESHYLDFSEILPQIPKKILDEITLEEEPFAAASIGQVHKGIRKSDGAELAVKIQYPGVKKAIDHDVRMLKLLIKASKILPKTMNSELVFAEIKDMLYQEMDYLQELELALNYASLCKAIPCIEALKPIAGLCSEKVYTTYYENCHDIGYAHDLNLTQDQRNELGMALLNVYFHEVFKWGVIQTDGNMGNFKIKVDESGKATLLLLDFGATKIVPIEVLKNYQNLIRGCVKGDEDLFFSSAKKLGYYEGEVDKDYFWEYACVFATPFREENYDWGKSDIPEKIMEYIPRTIQKMPKGTPNGVAVYLDRKIVGVFFILKELGCNFNMAEVEGHKFL